VTAKAIGAQVPEHREDASMLQAVPWQLELDEDAGDVSLNRRGADDELVVDPLI
jgi:hypothetical protein